LSTVDYSKLLAEPDAVLLRESDSVRDHVMLFTIPLVFFRSAIEPGGVVATGSAVLLRIGNHYFALTAGHCVNAKQGDIATSVVLHRHRFELSCVNFSMCWDRGSLDFGYFEINPETAKNMEAHAKAFLSLDNLDVVTKTECLERNDWIIVAGFPDEYIQGNKQIELGFRPIYYVSTLSGILPAPPSPAPEPEPSIHTIDVWAPHHGNLKTAKGAQEEILVPNLSGVSGGACWIGGVRPNPSAWNLKNIRLIGTHMGSTPALAPETCHDPSTAGFHARECLIGHHLCLIARNYPHLRESIYSKFPSINLFESSII
jgi:hypothetical protein